MKRASSGKIICPLTVFARCLKALKRARKMTMHLNRVRGAVLLSAIVISCARSVDGESQAIGTPEVAGGSAGAPVATSGAGGVATGSGMGGATGTAGSSLVAGGGGGTGGVAARDGGGGGA